MESAKNDERILWIDKAKGIAIILVIIGHVSGQLRGTWNFQFVYGIHLTMFFLLSGYLLKQKPLTMSYVNNKFRRLMIPYFYTCAAVLGMEIFNEYYLYRNYSLENITKKIFIDLRAFYFASGTISKFGSIDLQKYIGAVWFLPAMFFALLIFQIILQYSGGSSIKAGAAACSSALLATASGRFIWLPFSVQSGMFAVFFIWAGYEIKQRKLLEKVRPWHYVLAQIILLVGIHYGYCNISFVTANIADLISIPVGFAGCLLIYLIAQINPKRSFLSVVGEDSLTILCTHLFTLNTLKRYINILLDLLSLQGNNREWMRILLNILIALLLAYLVRIIHRCHQHLIRNRSKENYHEFTAWNIAAGLFTVSAVFAANFSMNYSLLNMINSCVPVFFILYAGYRRSFRSGFFSRVSDLAKTFLLPWLLCFIGNLALNFRYLNGAFISAQVRKYLLSMSAADKILPDSPTVGAVYLLPMLFCTGILFELIHVVFKDYRARAFILLALSLIGTALGTQGIWLPWSLDTACYALLYYAAGTLFRQKDLFTRIHSAGILYFVISTLWVYSIYAFGIELSIRNYGHTQYWFAAAGAIAGSLLLCEFSAHLAVTFPWLSKALQETGRSFLFILAVDELLGNRVLRFLETRGLPADQVLNPALTLFVVISLGIIVHRLCSRLIPAFRSERSEA